VNAFQKGNRPRSRPAWQATGVDGPGGRGSTEGYEIRYRPGDPGRALRSPPSPARWEADQEDQCDAVIARGRPQIALGVRLAAAVLLTAALPAPVQPATWRIVHDPAMPVDQVGTVALQAADGDSILVGPGTYYEHIPIVGKSLTFLSSDGADQTILDGSRAIPGREGSIFYDPSVTTAPLVIEGFTLRGGTGQFSYGGFMGGAVSWYNHYSVSGKSLRMRACSLEANHLVHGEGDAIFCEYMDSVRIESCTFRDNGGSTSGEVYVAGAGIVISDCTFHMSEHWQEGVVSCPGATDVKVLDCRFDASGGGFSSLYLLNVKSILLSRNSFVDRGSSPTATNLRISELSVYPPAHQTITMTGNLFWFAAGPDSGGPSSVQVTAMRQRMDVENNTFVRCGLLAGAGGGQPNLYANNIFYRSTVRLSGSIGGQVRCNDAWPKEIVTDVSDIYSLVDNISAEPLFCGESDGDFHISTISRCAAENSPNGCGLIGVYEPACGPPPVFETNWGRVKFLMGGKTSGQDGMHGTGQRTR
jgi:hypothetical protein